MEKELIKDFPVSKLIPYERNPRINKNAVDAVIRSIKRTGNIDPIEINESNIILCGHTRVKALQKLGINKTDVLRVSGLTEQQQIEYRILNNKTAEIAEWDFEILEADFTTEQLNEFGFFGKGVNDVYSEYIGMPEYNNEDKTAFRDIIVHFPNQDSVDKFSKLLECIITDKTRYIWFPQIIIEKAFDKFYES